MSPTAKPAIMGGKTRVLGSITVIDTPLVTRAMDYARTHSEPFLFNHAVRSWLFAAGSDSYRAFMKRCFTDSVCGIVKAKPETTYDNFARVSCQATTRSLPWTS